MDLEDLFIPGAELAHLGFAFPGSVPAHGQRCTLVSPLSRTLGQGPLVASDDARNVRPNPDELFQWVPIATFSPTPLPEIPTMGYITRGDRCVVGEVLTLGTPEQPTQFIRPPLLAFGVPVRPTDTVVVLPPLPPLPQDGCFCVQVPPGRHLPDALHIRVVARSGATAAAFLDDAVRTLTDLQAPCASRDMLSIIPDADDGGAALRLAIREECSAAALQPYLQRLVHAAALAGVSLMFPAGWLVPVSFYIGRCLNMQNAGMAVPSQEPAADQQPRGPFTTAPALDDGRCETNALEREVDLQSEEVYMHVRNHVPSGAPRLGTVRPLVDTRAFAPLTRVALGSGPGAAGFLSHFASLYTADWMAPKTRWIDCAVLGRKIVWDLLAGNDADRTRAALPCLHPWLFNVAAGQTWRSDGDWQCPWFLARQTDVVKTQQANLELFAPRDWQAAAYWAMCPLWDGEEDSALAHQVAAAHALLDYASTVGWVVTKRVTE